MPPFKLPFIWIDLLLLVWLEEIPFRFLETFDFHLPIFIIQKQTQTFREIWNGANLSTLIKSHAWGQFTFWYYCVFIAFKYSTRNLKKKRFRFSDLQAYLWRRNSSNTKNLYTLSIDLCRIRNKVLCQMIQFDSNVDESKQTRTECCNCI